MKFFFVDCHNSPAMPGILSMRYFTVLDALQVQPC